MDWQPEQICIPCTGRDQRLPAEDHVVKRCVWKPLIRHFLLTLGGMPRRAVPTLC